MCESTAKVYRVLPAILLLLAICNVLHAQWYTRSCGVADPENMDPDQFECLWKKSNTIATVGKITCGVGTAVFLVGSITMVAANPCTSSGLLLLGGFTAITGLAVDAIGAPIWIVGGTRKSKLKANPLYDDRQKFSLRISPSLKGIDPGNQHAFGMSVTIYF